MIDIILHEDRYVIINHLIRTSIMLNTVRDETCIVSDTIRDYIYYLLRT